MDMQAPASNLEIVFADWLDAIRRDDHERMRARLAPGVVHQGVRPELVCRTPDEVVAVARRRRGLLPRVDAIELVAAGDQVVMSVRGRELGLVDESGQPVGEATVVFTFQDGLIITMQDYRSRSEALAATGVAEQWS
jgi:SnoaL-like domain